MTRERHTIDAAGEGIGRLATRIATLLQGKHKPTYQPHIDEGDFVEIVNVDQLKISPKKINEKIYRRHTMHPGGLKTTRLKDILSSAPEKAIEMAVARMLPKNKLRTNRLKRLTFKKSL